MFVFRAFSGNKLLYVGGQISKLFLSGGTDPPPPQQTSLKFARALMRVNLNNVQKSNKGVEKIIFWREREREGGKLFQNNIYPWIGLLSFLVVIIEKVSK